MSARPDPHLTTCGGDDWPSTGDDSCCIGAAVYGPNRCTCWEPVLHPPITSGPHEGPMAVRDGMCGDCAFRPDSPERTGDESAAADAEDLEDLVLHGQFLCHQGMPRPTVWVHEPTGTEHHRAGDHMAYSPLRRGPRSWQADGQPALHCAGWAARRRALLAGVDRAADLGGAR